MRHVVLGVMAAALLAGCNGSDPEEGSSTGPVRSSAGASAESKEFVRQVDALCGDVKPELAGIRTALTQARDAGRSGRASLPKTFDVFATLLRRASAITARFEARLRAIRVPENEKAFHDALLSSVAKGSSNLRRQLSAAEAQDARRLRDLSIEGSVISARQKGLVAGHGRFRFCGRE